MKLQLAALIATSIIAIVAAVFAIWPVVADAPWESNPATYCEAIIDTWQEAWNEGETEFAEIILFRVGAPEGCYLEE